MKTEISLLENILKLLDEGKHGLACLQYQSITEWIKGADFATETKTATKLEKANFYWLLGKIARKGIRKALPNFNSAQVTEYFNHAFEWVQRCLEEENLATDTLASLITIIDNKTSLIEKNSQEIPSLVALLQSFFDNVLHFFQETKTATNLEKAKLCFLLGEIALASIRKALPNFKIVQVAEYFNQAFEWVQRCIEEKKLATDTLASLIKIISNKTSLIEKNSQDFSSLAKLLESFFDHVVCFFEKKFFISLDYSSLAKIFYERVKNSSNPQIRLLTTRFAVAYGCRALLSDSNFHDKDLLTNYSDDIAKYFLLKYQNKSFLISDSSQVENLNPSRFFVSPDETKLSAYHFLNLIYKHYLTFYSIEKDDFYRKGFLAQALINYLAAISDSLSAFKDNLDLQNKVNPFIKEIFYGLPLPSDIFNKNTSKALDYYLAVNKFFVEHQDFLSTSAQIDASTFIKEIYQKNIATITLYFTTQGYDPYYAYRDFDPELHKMVVDHFYSSFNLLKAISPEFETYFCQEIPVILEGITNSFIMCTTQQESRLYDHYARDELKYKDLYKKISNYLDSFELLKPFFEFSFYKKIADSLEKMITSDLLNHISQTLIKNFHSSVRYRNDNHSLSLEKIHVECITKIFSKLKTNTGSVFIPNLKNLFSCMVYSFQSSLWSESFSPFFTVEERTKYYLEATNNTLPDKIDLFEKEPDSHYAKEKLAQYKNNLENNIFPSFSKQFGIEWIASFLREAKTEVLLSTTRYVYGYVFSVVPNFYLVKIRGLSVTQRNELFKLLFELPTNVTTLSNEQHTPAYSAFPPFFLFHVLLFDGKNNDLNLLFKKFQKILYRYAQYHLNKSPLETLSQIQSNIREQILDSRLETPEKNPLAWEPQLVNLFKDMLRCLSKKEWQPSEACFKVLREVYLEKTPEKAKDNVKEIILDGFEEAIPELEKVYAKVLISTGTTVTIHRDINLIIILAEALIKYPNSKAFEAAFTRNISDFNFGQMNIEWPNNTTSEFFEKNFILAMLTKNEKGLSALYKADSQQFLELMDKVNQVDVLRPYYTEMKPWWDKTFAPVPFPKNIKKSVAPIPSSIFKQVFANNPEEGTSMELTVVPTAPVSSASSQAQKKLALTFG